MPKTFLEACSDVLRDVGEVSGDLDGFADLEDSGRRTKLAVVRRAWNHVLDQIYTLSREPLPRRSVLWQLATRVGFAEYALPRGFVSLRFPLRRVRSEGLVWEYPGGYAAMRAARPQPEQWTGDPSWAVVEPTRGNLLFDTIPQVADLYEVLYERDMYLWAETDLFPCSDGAVDALIPAVAEVYKQRQFHQADPAIYRQSMGAGARMISPRTLRRTY